jgi:oligoendopeptidase F
MDAPVDTRETPPRWRLDDLYAGRDDPEIEADLAAAGALTDDLAELEGAFLAARAEPARLGALIDRAIRLCEEAIDKAWGVAAFASLSGTVDHGDSGWARLEADIRARLSANDAKTIFFTLELNQLEDGEIAAALAAHPPAARWAPWLRRVRLCRPHELSPDLERMFVDRAPAVANWTRLYDDILARLTARVGRERLTLPQVVNRMSDPKAARRKAAANGLAQALAEQEETVALVYNTVAAEKQVEDRWRRFADPAASRHLSNEIPSEAVAALEASVVGNYERLSWRYFRLKAKVMRRRTLDYWDRQAPLTESEPRSYPWSEAKSRALEAFGGLSPTFASAAERFLAAPWTDAEPRKGKQSGAFSHPVTANRHPYVFLNYMGERGDVLTLAHELGHAVHQTLAAPNGTLLADTPLTLAETASIFGEGLVFERLLADALGAERRDLLAGRIEDALNTVVRQISFHRFETRFHDQRRSGELAPEAIGAIWLEVMGESFGPAVKLNPGYEHYWAHVSHFVHTPFYVYAYAFGNLLVEALMEARRKDPTGFAPLYEDLLSAGGTRTCVEALAPFGLDPRERSFWDAGCDHISRLVDAFEALT